MTLHKLATILVLAGCAATDGASAEPVAPPPPPPGPALPPPPPGAEARIAPGETATTRDGTIQQVARTPHGDVAVLILDDGTAVHVPPHVFGAAAPERKARVHVEGALAGTHLRATALTIAGKAMALAAPGTPPPPPDRASALAAIEDTSTIARTIAAPDGSPEILVLADGASVTLGPPLRAAAAQLHAGATVHVRGEGGKYAGSTAMRARTLEVNGATLVDDAPLPPHAPAPLPPPPPHAPPPFPPPNAPAPFPPPNAPAPLPQATVTLSPTTVTPSPATGTPSPTTGTPSPTTGTPSPTTGTPSPAAVTSPPAPVR